MRREYGVERLILSGCSAVNIGEELACELYVEKTFTRNDSDAIAKYLGHGVGTSQSRETFAGRVRGFVKIQDGCNQFCSYCIVPLVRGRERSEEPSKIVKRVAELHSAGVHEAVLTGVHDGRYFRDGLDLSGLCRKILDETDIFRIRLSSIEPTEITDDLIDLLAESSRVASHLHVPLQSGSDAVLERMRRPYKSAFYRSAIERLHTNVNNIGIGADVIVGFPGETDDDFQRTYDLIESLPLSYLHVFRYSRREGTDAADFLDQVREEIKRERMERLIGLRDRKKQEFAETQMGVAQTVIVERVSVDNIASGWSDNYMRAFFVSDYISVNNIVLLNPISYNKGIINCEIKDLIL